MPTLVVGGPELLIPAAIVIGIIVVGFVLTRVFKKNPTP